MTDHNDLPEDDVPEVDMQAHIDRLRERFYALQEGKRQAADRESAEPEDGMPDEDMEALLDRALERIHAIQARRRRAAEAAGAQPDLEQVLDDLPFIHLERALPPVSPDTALPRREVAPYLPPAEEDAGEGPSLEEFSAVVRRVMARFRIKLQHLLDATPPTISMRFYMLQPDGTVIETRDAEEWEQWYEDSENRRVAEDYVQGYRVSTVCLGLDHRLAGGGPPLIFETMVFPGHAVTGFQEGIRSSTSAEARETHRLTCLQVSRDWPPLPCFDDAPGE